MIALPPGTKVFVACQPIDLRAGFDGLAAKVQQIIGAALERLRERESGTAHLEAAVAAYNEALKEYTRERVPLQWAMTTGNQGLVLMLIAGRNDDVPEAQLSGSANRDCIRDNAR